MSDVEAHVNSLLHRQHQKPRHTELLDTPTAESRLKCEDSKQLREGMCASLNVQNGNFEPSSRSLL